MKTLSLTSVTTIVVAACLLTRPLFADGPTARSSQHREQEVAVFVTGSLIPQRIKVRRIGTNAAAPVRIIDRQEIDQTGRLTTSGALINDPSVRVIGH